MPWVIPPSVISGQSRSTAIEWALLLAVMAFLVVFNLICSGVVQAPSGRTYRRVVCLVVTLRRTVRRVVCLVVTFGRGDCGSATTAGAAEHPLVIKGSAVKSTAGQVRGGDEDAAAQPPLDTDTQLPNPATRV
jgi:hypothetical protein